MASISMVEGKRAGRGPGHWRNQPAKPGSDRALRQQCAAETVALLPDLIASLSTPVKDSVRFTGPHQLKAAESPNLPKATVHVVNGDTLDIALSLIKTDSTAKPPLILNMASEKNPGGGWLNGSMAQEEAICYRSSLSMTLHKQFYPMKPNQAIYSPHILVIRESATSGHGLLDLSKPDELKVLATVSVAAVRRPALDKRRNAQGETVEFYAKESDEELMKMKMRVILRVGAEEGHRCLVLGALGCGAFHNPKYEVVRLWKEVLEEDEWKGWFEELVFAVLDTRNEGNFEAFRDELAGLKV